MYYLISFKTKWFDISNEEENLINPIKGKSIGDWITELLKNDGIKSTSVEAEDWGWYCYATLQEFNYLVGFIALPSDLKNKGPEIIIQINKHRAIIDRLSGKNKMAEQDPLLLLIERYIKGIQDISDFEIIKSI